MELRKLDIKGRSAKSRLSSQIVIWPRHVVVNTLGNIKCGSYVPEKKTLLRGVSKTRQPRDIAEQWRSEKKITLSNGD